MNRIWIEGMIVAVLTAFTSIVYASGDDGTFQKGARASSLGGASVTLSDRWAAFNNIAGIAELDKAGAGFGFIHAFGVAAWNTSYAVVHSPIRKGAAALTVERWGDAVFSRTLVGAGFAHKINYVSLGAQLVWHQTAVSEVGTLNRLLINFGGIAQIIPELVFAAHITNLNQAKVADFRDERLPTVLKAGLSYRPGKRFMANAETMKDVDLPAVFRFGAEYAIVEEVLFGRMGALTEPAMSSYGLGFCHKAWRIDYGIQFQTRLGFAHHLSILVDLHSKRKP